jgi:hypothetical protein
MRRTARKPPAASTPRRRLKPADVPQVPVVTADPVPAPARQATAPRNSQGETPEEEAARRMIEAAYT